MKKYCVITGASSGIGQQVAYELSLQKKNIILIARRVDRLKKVSQKCLKLGSPAVQILALDVQKNNSQKIKKYIKQLDGSVEILINSAGLAKGTEPFQKSTLENAEQMIQTNMTGLVSITHGFIPEIIKNKGHIVNLGSVAGRLVYEGGSVYCATKFAVRAFNDGLRMDLKGTGVRVTNIEPGMVETEFSIVRLGNQQKADAVYDDMMPLTAEDIAKTILWCLQQPAHVNIQELVIYPTDQASIGQVVRGEKSVKKLK